MQKRAVYLHEAGHAVIGHKIGLIVEGACCDGSEGLVEATLSPQAQQVINNIENGFKNKSISADEYTRQIIIAFKSWLVYLLGGLAGESLEDGRAIPTSFRAADDLSSFFGLLCKFTPQMSSKNRDDLWQQTFRDCMASAGKISEEQQSKIRTLADELEKRRVIQGRDLMPLLR